MDLLMVDDENSMLEALHVSLSWEHLPFDTVRTANSKSEAIGLLKQQTADVILCDIEMPGGSGLELLEWVRENFPLTCCILLTSHADFSYAQRAVKLGSFDYVLKPVQFEQLEETLRKAAEQAKCQCELSHAGMYWEEGRKSAEHQFWQDLFVGEIQPNAESIARYIGQKHLSIPHNGLFLPILICPHDWENLPAQDHALFLYALRNITEEILSSTKAEISVHPFARKLVLAIAQLSEEDNDWTEQFEEKCSSVQQAVENSLHRSVCCYIGECGILSELPAQLERMQEADFNNVIATSKIIKMQAYTVSAIPYQNSVFTEWELLLENHAYDRVRKEVNTFLSHMAQHDQLNREVLDRFYNDFYCLLYNNANRDHVFLNTLYGDRQSARLSSAARQTVQNMDIWTQYALDKMKHFHQENESESSPVARVCRYIQQHLEDDIPVDLLAEIAHLNADYLNRIFKKEKGVSLNQYVIQKKMEKAKWYLCNTDETIASVAAKVGYYNYSSFNRVFLRTVGCAPRDWKLKNQRY